MTTSRKKSNGKSGCLLITVAIVLLAFVARSVNLGGVFNFVSAIVLSVPLIFIIWKMLANRQYRSLILSLLVVALFIGSMRLFIKMNEEYNAGWKIESTIENHARIKSFIVASLNKCGMGQIVELPGYTSVSCENDRKYSSAQWAKGFYEYSKRAGFKNHYQGYYDSGCGKCGPAMFISASKNPMLGRTHIYAQGNEIHITTQPGTVDGGPTTVLTDTVIVE